VINAINLGKSTQLYVERAQLAAGLQMLITKLRQAGSIASWTAATVSLRSAKRLSQHHYEDARAARIRRAGCALARRPASLSPTYGAVDVARPTSYASKELSPKS